MMVPLQFPAIYVGQFAQVDDEREELVNRYIWGVHVMPDGREHVVGRRPSGPTRAERSLVSVATCWRWGRFVHVNGDTLDCRAMNLRCMNPKKFLKNFGHEYPGPKSTDDDYKWSLENEILRRGEDVPRKKIKRKADTAAEIAFMRQIFFP